MRSTGREVTHAEFGYLFILLLHKRLSIPCALRLKSRNESKKKNNNKIYHFTKPEFYLKWARILLAIAVLFYSGIRVGNGEPERIWTECRTLCSFFCLFHLLVHRPNSMCVLTLIWMRSGASTTESKMLSVWSGWQGSPHGGSGNRSELIND